LLAACSPASPAATAQPSPTAAAAASQAPTATTAQQPTTTADEVKINRRVEDFEAYIPPSIIPRDGIRPIYQPEFQSAAQAPLKDDELVLGVAIEDEAKAYPITVLRFREMVNDEMKGIPTLVTW
jgi:hypothetical protein